MITERGLKLEMDNFFIRIKFNNVEEIDTSEKRHNPKVARVIVGLI